MLSNEAPCQSARTSSQVRTPSRRMDCMAFFRMPGRAVKGRGEAASGLGVWVMLGIPWGEISRWTNGAPWCAGSRPIV